jgi:voltage-gated potassium channel
MLMGYAIIAVPTGIVTTEMVLAMKKRRKSTSLPGCGRGGS